MIPPGGGRSRSCGCRSVGAAAAAAVVRASLRVARRLSRLATNVVGRVIVDGSSMAPALAPGDRLVTVLPVRLRPGRIVAVVDPRPPNGLLVKRITSVDHRRKLVWVEGDNREESTDSRSFGPVGRAAVVGRVVYRYAPAQRAGPIGGGR